MQFERPVPGQSLTTTPKSAPYERPPEITDPIEALDYHLDKLDNVDSIPLGDPDSGLVKLTNSSRSFNLSSSLNSLGKLDLGILFNCCVSGNSALDSFEAFS